MVATPSKAQARLDKAKAKRDKRMARVDKQEAKGQDNIKKAARIISRRLAAKTRASLGPVAPAKSLETQWKLLVKSCDKARVRIDEKFAKEQARYDKAQDAGSK